MVEQRQKGGGRRKARMRGGGDVGQLPMNWRWHNGHQLPPHVSRTAALVAPRSSCVSPIHCWYQATTDFIMKNDTAVFAAMVFDAEMGENVWVGLTGTREAIQRDGYSINPISLNFCPHEWIDSNGYVDLDLQRHAPLAETLPHGAKSL
jgi:hypothetical protein